MTQADEYWATALSYLDKMQAAMATVERLKTQRRVRLTRIMPNASPESIEDEVSRDRDIKAAISDQQFFQRLTDTYVLLHNGALQRASQRG
jgi:hypothetical protein